jgi:deoxyribose-phosphate aldolase
MAMDEEKTYDYQRKNAVSYESTKLSAVFNQNGRLVEIELDDKAPQNAKSIAAMIDHTLLKADATEAQIVALCEEAARYNFAAVCVNSYWVNTCAELLKDTDVKVATVVGFPLGAMSTEAKVFETEDAILQGATEIDMVINIGELKADELANVAHDIRQVVRVAHQYDAIVKVIIETCLLTEEEKIKACLIAKSMGADFVKTSTGFAGGGATAEDVRLMRAVVGPEMGVKASGGVRSLADARVMIEAGANRIGASSGVKIVEEERK